MPDTDTPSAEELAAALDAHNRWRRGDDEPAPDPTKLGKTIDAAADALRSLASERDALKADNANLRTVMVAAAEELHAHWEAHCDAEGYGPANLMLRLEQGIPAKYGYTAGRFTQLVAERDALRDALDAEREACAKLCEEIGDGYQARESYKWAEMKTDAQTGAHDCATAIRARTTPPQQEPTA